MKEVNMGGYVAKKKNGGNKACIQNFKAETFPKDVTWKAS
jgi:hypothetical protein